MRPSKKIYYLNIAKAVSRRSTCLNKRYGCIIVKNDEIIATGYNGSPRGETNCCDIGYCARTQEGGHYSNDGDYNSCCSVHAEQNAMLSAARKDMIGATLYLHGEEKRKYLEKSHLHDGWKWREIENPEPCPICKRMIANAGIKEVVVNGGSLCTQ